MREALFILLIILQISSLIILFLQNKQLDELEDEIFYLKLNKKDR